MKCAQYYFSYFLLLSDKYFLIFGIEWIICLVYNIYCAYLTCTTMIIQETSIVRFFKDTSSLLQTPQNKNYLYIIFVYNFCVIFETFWLSCFRKRAVYIIEDIIRLLMIVLDIEVQLKSNIGTTSTLWCGSEVIWRIKVRYNVCAGYLCLARKARGYKDIL